MGLWVMFGEGEGEVKWSVGVFRREKVGRGLTASVPARWVNYTTVIRTGKVTYRRPGFNCVVKQLRF